MTGRGTLFEIFRLDESIRRVKSLIMENNRNSELIVSIYRVIDLNKSKSDTKDFITARLRESSIKLLVTERYLERDDSFYQFLVLDDIIKVNSELNRWTLDYESSEIWFINNKEVIEKKFTKLNNVLADLYKELEKRQTFT